MFPAKYSPRTELSTNLWQLAQTPHWGGGGGWSREKGRPLNWALCARIWHLYFKKRAISKESCRLLFTKLTYARSSHVVTSLKWQWIGPCVINCFIWEIDEAKFMPTVGESKRLCIGCFRIKFMWLFTFIHLVTRSLTPMPDAQHCVACKNRLFVNCWVTGQFLI